MTFPELVRFGATLFRKYQTAASLAQQELRICFREAIRSGTIPLGYGKDEAGHDVAKWLLFDESKYASDTELYDALVKKSPRGVAFKIIRI